MKLTPNGRNEATQMNFKRNFLILTLAGFLLAACGRAAPAETISEEDVMMTYSVGTMVAGFFATQTAMVAPTPANTNTPPPTNTFPPPPTIANTPIPAAWTPVPIFYTATLNVAVIPSVTGTPPTTTPDTGALASGCNNSAFIRDANYPPGSTVSPGEEFVKTWKVQNIGSCEWQYNYGMAVISDKFFDSSWNRLGRNVLPGDWAEVSVIVSAPKNDGTYTGSWRMADAGGNAFGATLTLTIVVP